MHKCKKNLTASECKKGECSVCKNQASNDALVFIGGDSSSGMRPTADAHEPKIKGSFNIGPVAKSGGKRVVVSIRGPIGGFFGVNSQEFISDLEKKAAKAEHIQVLINSGGGDVFEATAIYNCLENHKAKITTTVEGVAASAATVIAQAGDVRQVPSNSYYMIHEVRGGIHGTAQELRNYIKLLDIANNNISNLYADRGGKDKTYVDDLLLNGDNWLTPEQVVEHGFADQVVESRKADPVVTPNSKIEISWTKRDWTSVQNIESDLRVLANSIGREGTDMFDKWLKAQGVDKSELSDAQVAVWKTVFDQGGFKEVEDKTVVTPPVNANQTQIDALKSQVALEAACGGDKELMIEALENKWSLEMTKLKAENKALTASKSSSPEGQETGGIWAGSFVVPSDTKEIAASREDAIIASLASQFTEVSFENLLDPFKGLSPEDRMLLQNTTGITPISEQTIEAGYKNFEGSLQDLAAYCAWKDGKQNNPFQFKTSSTLQASFSSATFPKKFLEVCERAMLASFRMVQPKWNRIAYPVNVADLQRHNQYRMYGTGRWEKKPTCGELTHGEIGIEPAHYNQASTHGQILEVCRDLILNNQIGSINAITSRFGMMGRMAPEWGVWDYVNGELCGESEFEFTISNFEKLWECFCRKGQYELSGVPKDKCEDFKIAIELGNPRLLVAKCDHLKVMKLLKGRIELCGQGGEECKQTAVMDAILDGMVDVCESSYMKPGCVVMIPAPTPIGSAIEVAFLRGRQLPTIERVPLASNKLGFGIRGFIDFGVNGTSNPFWCNQDMLNTEAEAESARLARVKKITKSLSKRS